MLRRHFLLVLLLCGLSAFTSCLKSKNPVSDPKKGGRDEALCGVWKHKEDDGTLWLLQIGYLEAELKAPWMGCTLTSNDGTEHASGFSPCFVSIVAGKKYLNFASDLDMTQDQVSKEPSLVEKISGYEIVKYEIQDETLTLTMCNFPALKDSISKGLIKGKDEMVTAKSEELASFLEKNDQKVFPVKENVRFTKVK